MWIRSRPLSSVTFAQRVAFPGAPLVWCGLFVHRTTGGFLAGPLGVALVVTYLLFVVWHSTLRDLQGTTENSGGARDWGLACSNVGADVGASVCFLFFLLNWCSAAWFPLVLLVAVVLHVLTEVVVQRRLRALHAYRGFWTGRKPDERELEALRQSVAPLDLSDPPERYAKRAAYNEGAASDA